MKITLPSGREIGDGCKTFVIAEVGSNWTCLEDCLLSIREAAKTGADAVKFQLFDHKALYGLSLSGFSAVGDVVLNPAAADSHGCNSPRATERPHRPPFLPIEWLPLLKAEADKYKIEFMCSAFSPELIEIVNPFVNIHKLASAEMTHVRMLGELMRFGKPIIMSTGASSLADIQRSMKFLGPERVILLYCIAAYPAKEINLANIRELSRLFHTLSGFSDHSTDVCVIPRSARDQGACVIEKHFTAIKSTTADSGHSLNPREFSRMVDCIHHNQVANLGPTEEEASMVSMHNRRIIAIKDISKGEELREGINIGIYRSLKENCTAFSPFMIDKVNGKLSLIDFKAGDGIWAIDHIRSKGK